MPVIETSKQFVKSTIQFNNSSEKDNDNTVDASQNSPDMTKRRENSVSKQMLQNYRQQPSHKAREQYDDIIRTWYGRAILRPNRLTYEASTYAGKPVGLC